MTIQLALVPLLKVESLFSKTDYDNRYSLWWHL